ncbi:MAG TPA: beta-ketoacyl synthase N-terminal-like domain-containing protein, partial [Thermodesulfobacteriota bacterium]|nr:beta-ketoacyl synthase N-terminal-like domain-containing protein [Thermodesulfobacteriota bacterium]
MGEVAIVGMACLFPGAPDIRTFWRNIVHKVDAISDPPDNWEGEPWYDPDSKAPDRIYMKRAGFLKDICRFDPVKYGIIPKAVNGSEPEHWLSLKIAYEALADAGVPEIPINRERTEVIMGRGTFVNRGYATMCHYSIGMDQALSML